MSNKKNYQDLTLVEAKKDAIVLAWGRFNPPTTGHEKLIKAVVSEAKKRRADYRIYPTKSIDPKKNPLTFKEKVRFMKQMFPKHARNISSEESVNTLIKAVQKLETEGYKTVTLIAGSDRITEFKTLLNKYNGKEYNFDSIDVVSAGDRDPDAEDVSGMSASKMRAAASDGDFNSFKKGVPNKKVAKKLYDAVRKGMKINERFDQDGIFDYIQMLNEDGVVGSRFNRLLRFGLATGGTGEIPVTKRAFKDFAKTGPNPILRDRVFSTVDRVFEYLLNDDVLYYRFLMLLHRQDIFGEGNYHMNFNELKTQLTESNQTAALSTADDHPEKMNFVAKFPSKVYADSFIEDMQKINLIDLSWRSNDGSEVQFYVRKSTSGQELPDTHTSQYGAEARIVDIVAKYGGSISRFDGDVREGLENETDVIIEGLISKAWKSEIAYDILSEVYIRGLRAWEEDCDKKDVTTQEQWAYSRVNSFIAGGKAQKENDSDLWEMHCLRLDEESSELDEAFISEIGTLGKAVAGGVAYALWKKRKAQQDKRKSFSKTFPPPKEEPKKKTGWRSQVDWNNTEEYVNEQFENEFSNIDTLFNIEISEIAGEWGTNTLRKKYAKDTPGQKMQEEAPPSDKAERFIKKNKKAFKDRYGEEWEQALYATAWKMHNKHFSKE